MSRISTITEANEALQPYVPLVAHLTGKDTVFDRIVPLMAMLGNPQDKTRIVHIAGTSGKTSTSYFISALLVASSKRVGLTVSPHVDSVTERVQMDGKPISEAVFCKYLSEFLDIVEQAPLKPSYFELLYAFSFWVFEKEQVDYAVVETGMGGLFDATNIAGRPDKLCIITDIGFDHMHVLGHSLPEIAAQKIGIVHEHNPVITYAQSTEVNEVFETWTQSHDAPLLMTSEATEKRNLTADFVADMPEFQQRNWLLAYKAYRFLVNRDGLPELGETLLQQTQALQVPGRMDRRRVGGKIIVMDGAHNSQKMETFLNSFKHAYPGIKPAVMLSLKEGKEPTTVAPLLAPLASRIIVTTFNTSQDLPARSIDPQLLAQLFRDAGAADVSVEPDQQQAYAQLLESAAEVCIVTGSFYLLSQLRDSEHLL